MCTDIPSNTSSRLTRHRLHRQYEIKPAFSAFSSALYERISVALGIPRTYRQLRIYANGCGAFWKHSTRDQHGQLERLGKPAKIRAAV